MFICINLYNSKKKGEGETDGEAQERKKSRCIWMTGKKGLTEREAAILILQEAKTLLQQDVGMLGIKWQPDAKVKSPKNTTQATPNQSSSSENSFRTPKNVIGLRRRRSSSVKRTLKQVANQKQRSPGESKRSPAEKSDYNAGEGEKRRKSITPPILSPPGRYLKRLSSDNGIQDVIANRADIGITNVNNTSVQKRKSTSPGPVLTKSPRNSDKCDLKSVESKAEDDGIEKNKNWGTKKSHLTVDSMGKNIVKQIDIDRNDVDKIACKQNMVIVTADVQGHVSQNSGSEKLIDNLCKDRTGNKISLEKDEKCNKIDKIKIINGKISPHSVSKTGLMKIIPQHKDEAVSPDLYSEPANVKYDKDKQIFKVKNQESPELYTESANPDGFDDSFALNSQMVQLMGKHFPGSLGNPPQNEIERNSDNKENNNKECSHISVTPKGHRVNVSDESPDIFSQVAQDQKETDTKFNNKENTDFEYSPDADLNNYLNEYSTQKHTDIIAQSASPELKLKKDKHLNKYQPLGTSIIENNSFELLPEDGAIENVEIPFSNFTDLKNTHDKVKVKSNATTVQKSRDKRNNSEVNELKSNCNVQNQMEETMLTFSQIMNVLEAEETVNCKSGLDKSGEKVKTENSVKNGTVCSVERMSGTLVNEINDSLTLSMIDNITNKGLTNELKSKPRIAINNSEQRNSVLKFGATNEMKCIPKNVINKCNVNEEKISVIHKKCQNKGKKLETPNKSASCSIKFSPGTEALLDTLSGEYDTKRKTAPKRKKVVSEEPLIEKKDDVLDLSENSVDNNDSDYIPPTPQKQTGTPKHSLLTPKRGKITPKTTGRANNASRKNGETPVKLSGDSVDSGIGISASTTPVKKLLKRSERDTPNRKKKNAKTQTNHQKNENTPQETLNTGDISVTFGKKLIQTKIDVTCTSDLSSCISSTCDSFCIIDVASHHELFNEFLHEWKTKSKFSLCLACEKVLPAPITGGGIGGNFNKGLFL